MKDIKKYLDEERDGKYSFYFEDLDGGYTYGYNQTVPQTSAGCMKLMLAVALSHDARLLILDEPTSGLDVLARDELMDILAAAIEDGDPGVPEPAGQPPQA